MDVHKAAIGYRGEGFSVIPLDGKRPLVQWKKYQRRPPDNSELWEFFGEADGVNVGIVCGDVSGSLLVLDWDNSDLYTDWALAHPNLADTRRVETGSGGRHTYFRLSHGDGLSTQPFYWNGGRAGEVRFNGGQVVAPPSVHPDTGEPYSWLTGKDIPIREIEDVNDLGITVRHPRETSNNGGGPIPIGSRNSHLTSLAGSMKRRSMSDEAIRQAILVENQERCDPPLSEGELALTIFRSIERWETPQLKLEANLTDVGNARRLVAQHGHELHYVYAWGSWLIWDGTRWARDMTGEIERRAKDTVRRIYHEAGEAPDEQERKSLARHAERSEASYRLRAMIEQARSEPGSPVLPEELDSDPWLLNVQNGTLDLRSGRLLPHCAGDMITKLARTHYDPDATAPRWGSFLRRIMAGNEELMAFLQRTVGYALTGSTREQALLILHGDGANGKSTFVEAIRAVLGDDYAQQAPVEAVLMRRYGSHPTDIARMKGLRFISTNEVEHGRRLAESLVKQLTGGDKVTARFMHQDSFEFKPQFKLFMATNHKPKILGTDLAIWRRIRLVPFTVTIPEAEQDRSLPEKLKAELPGILRWAVEGCLAWQEEGLGEPIEVTEATASYRDEMDLLARFLDECCTRGESLTARAGELYKVYRGWCSANGEEPISGTAFGRQLSRSGFSKAKDRKGWYYLGIGLLAETQDDLPM